MKTIIFQVSYLGVCGCGGRKFERKIEMTEGQTLVGLHDRIMRELHWDDDHLYSFFLSNKAWDNKKAPEYTRPGNPEKEGAKSAKIELKKLGLERGQKFVYIFDFGDEHRFRITVKEFGNADAKEKYPKTLESKGKPFEQYYGG